MTQPSKRLSVLIISFSNLGTDPRVYRQVQYFLRINAQVSALADLPFPDENVAFFPTLPKGQKYSISNTKKILSLFTPYEQTYENNPKIKHCLSIDFEKDFDLIISNDIETLPLATRLAKKNPRAKVIFDAHEYAPKEFEDILRWRLFHRNKILFFCKKYIPQCNFMTTVCQSISDVYERNYGKSSTIIFNTPLFKNLQPQNIDPNCIRMIYHGSADPSRGIEDVFKLMNLVDSRFFLDIILIPGDQRYISQLRKIGQKSKHVRFLDPVPMNDIPSFCNQYDIGLYPLKPSSFNCYHALPNKFFEFIQARIAPAIYPQPEMAKILREYSCGIVANDFLIEGLANRLNQLTANELLRMKENTDKAASVFCAEKNNHKFDEILKQLNLL